MNNCCCVYVLATEPVGPTKRGGAAGMSTFYFFSGGIAALSGIAYAFRSWRALYIATSILFLVFVLPFVSESLIRSLYLIPPLAPHPWRGGPRHASHCPVHGDLPATALLALEEEVSGHSPRSTSTKQEAVTGSLVDVLRCPLRRARLFLAVAVNFFCSVVYYGLSLNVVNLGTNLYLNAFLNAVAEMPAFFLTAVLLDRYGRKSLSIGTQWFSGAFCLLGGLMKGYGVWKTVRMVCGILGIFGMAGTYNLLFIYTVELFPTVVRNAALGCATQAAQMGAILAPFVAVMGERVPFLVFGACGLAGGTLTFLLPETLNRPLYDTMTGMEEGEGGGDLLN
ncbi:organic cation/carnitine transporter 4-like [Salvia splendens]|uniref:organic cation/carnitine transporter 4-like n=1 Tax=Salvia splendens TaxID=180675 RepID=UPI001C26B207|nr:organic cation/carnitine transporter 4-like [Salvia splendens]